MQWLAELNSGSSKTHNKTKPFSISQKSGGRDKRGAEREKETQAETQRDRQRLIKVNREKEN